jgi:hypothetical protein
MYCTSDFLSSVEPLFLLFYTHMFYCVFEGYDQRYQDREGCGNELTLGGGEMLSGERKKKGCCPPPPPSSNGSAAAVRSSSSPQGR